MAQKAFSNSPAMTASVASKAAPAERKAAFQVCEFMEVSGSSDVCVGPPACMSSASASLKPLSEATYMRPWANSMSAKEAGDGSLRSKA